MTGLPVPTSEEIRGQLTEALGPPTSRGPVRVMGAGTDDLEEGRRYLHALAPGGWLVPRWPQHAGGRGATEEQATAVTTELAAWPAPDLYPYMVGVALVGPTVLEHGTPAQQRRWLPAIRDGSEIWCQLFSEPGAGSDLAGLGTRAVRDGDVWRVTGQKVWSSRAHYSQWGLLLARTNPDVPKHDGITCFALRMDQPGVTVRPLRQMNGDVHFNEVFLDAAVLDDADRIDRVDGGWAVARTTLAVERASLGGSGGGGLRTDDLIALVRRNGRDTDPLVRQRLAAAAGLIEVGRLTARRGRSDPIAAAGSKLRMTGTVKRIAELAAAVRGAAGLLDADEWSTLLLTAPSLSIRGGTDEIQRNIVGERVLGLPREPEADRGVPWREVRHS